MVPFNDQMSRNTDGSVKPKILNSVPELTPYNDVLIDKIVEAERLHNELSENESGFEKYKNRNQFYITNNSSRKFNSISPSVQKSNHRSFEKLQDRKK